ncbi:Global transcription regulator sge1 [Kickxella alabastrina]|uniref:Global transcription regulator sge1 n=1 Tax=Kickxella alabastrina TaxID=61397 RepID=A0ACC1IVL3_9FUNG|nr:Global transcription regulator sge1 [Kickxella alabastrina]
MPFDSYPHPHNQDPSADASQHQHQQHQQHWPPTLPPSAAHQAPMSEPDAISVAFPAPISAPIDPHTVLSSLDTSPDEVIIGGIGSCFTVTGMHVQTTRDALTIFEACRQSVLPRVIRRLNESEKQQINDGTIVVFDEKEAKMKRWTDGRLWTPSRILGNFLVYRELDRKLQPNQEGANEILRMSGCGNGVSSSSEYKRPGTIANNKGVFYPKSGGLMKRTISLAVPENEDEYLEKIKDGDRVPRVPRVHQQHLISYFRAETSAVLPTPDDIEELRNLRLPLPLLRIQRFRRPVKIEVIGDDGDAYNIYDSDVDEENEDSVRFAGRQPLYSSSSPIPQTAAPMPLPTHTQDLGSADASIQQQQQLLLPSLPPPPQSEQQQHRQLFPPGIMLSQTLLMQTQMMATPDYQIPTTQNMNTQSSAQLQPLSLQSADALATAAALANFTPSAASSLAFDKHAGYLFSTATSAAEGEGGGVGNDNTANQGCNFTQPHYLSSEDIYAAPQGMADATAFNASEELLIRTELGEQLQAAGALEMTADQMSYFNQLYGFAQQQQQQQQPAVVQNPESSSQMVNPQHRGQIECASYSQEDK